MIIKFFEKNYNLSFLISFLIAFVIFYISSRESFPTTGASGNWVADAYHFCVFFFFTAFLLLALVRGKRKKWFLLGVLISLFYAILDEFHQIFVYGRYPSFGDVLVDSAGIFLATLVYISIIYSRD